MYKIALLYEHTSREVTALNRLKQLLENKIECKVYLFSIQFQIYELYKSNKKKAFDAIVVPYVYKEGSLNPIGKILKKNKQIIIYNLHHEQLSPPFDEPRMLPCDSISKNMVVHFVWNDRFKRKLIKLGTNDERIFITGNIRSDDLRIDSPRSIRNRFALEFNLDVKKKWIMICESWGQILSDQLMKSRILTGVKLEDMNTFNSLTDKAMKEFSKQSFELDDNIFKEYEIIYRNHPGANEGIILNPKIHKISNHSVYEWFQCVIANIARNSTTLFEADKAGILPIRYDPTKMDLYYIQEGIDQYYTITNLNDIKGIETKISTGSRSVYKEYLGECDGNSTERVASVIANTIGDSRFFFVSNDFKYDKKRYLRKCLSNIIGYIFVRSSLSMGKRIMPSLRLYNNDIPENWKSKKKKRV